MRRLAQALFLFPLVLAGCVQLSTTQPPGPWHEAYESIDDAESVEFLDEALKQAKVEFGEPAVPVNKVLLRRSRKTEEARRYRIGEDFSLTQCIDTTNGIFVVYIGVDQDHENYFALLGHECTHLINPRIMDWYMEGIAMLFSKETCAAQERPWGNWEPHYGRSRRDPYAVSYRMMRDLKNAFPEAYPALVRCLEPNGQREGWLRIDIDEWLDRLPDGQRRQALDIMEPHVSLLRKRRSSQYDFDEPKELK